MLSCISCYRIMTSGSHDQGSCFLSLGRGIGYQGTGGRWAGWRGRGVVDDFQLTLNEG